MPLLQSIQEADSQTAVDLWNAAEPFDWLSRELLQEKVWGDPDFDPALTLVCKAQQQLQGFAVAVCRHREESVTGYIKLLAVAPDIQRRGMGSALYQELEHRCRQRGVQEMRVAESAPNYLQPGVDQRCEAALAFFAHHGFAEVGRACNMTVDLGEWQRHFGKELGSGEQPSGCQFLRATPAHEPALRAFLDHHWPSWWGEASVALRNEPVSLFLAMDADRIIGFAAHDANNRGTGWFGPMGSCPEQRGRGIGRQLLVRCLADMSERGYPRATIPWVGPVDFYREQCGAVVDRNFVRLSKKLI